MVSTKCLVLSVKGGVGKSVVAANLAWRLSKHGRTGALDLDLDSPHLPIYLGVDSDKISLDAEGLRFVPHTMKGWKYDIKIMSLRLMLDMDGKGFIQPGEQHSQIIQDVFRHTKWGPLTYLVCDAPAGVRDEFRTVLEVFKQIPSAVIVAQPDLPESLERAIDVCSSYHVPVVGVIENMGGPAACAQCGHDVVCKECNTTFVPFSDGAIKKVCEKTGVKYLGSIPFDPTISDNPILDTKHSDAIVAATEAIMRSRDG